MAETRPQKRPQIPVQTPVQTRPETSTQTLTRNAKELLSQSQSSAREKRGIIVKLIGLVMSESPRLNLEDGGGVKFVAELQCPKSQKLMSTRMINSILEIKQWTVKTPSKHPWNNETRPNIICIQSLEVLHYAQPAAGGGGKGRESKSGTKNAGSKKSFSKAAEATSNRQVKTILLSTLTPAAPAFKWEILVQVSNKDPIKTYKNQRGPGKLGNVELMDTRRTKIRATMFNEDCDSFYPLFQANKWYRIGGASVKATNPQFNNTGHPCELKFNHGTKVTPVTNEPAFVVSSETLIAEQLQKIKPQSLASIIESASANTRVDIVAALIQMDPVARSMSKDGKREIVRRAVVFADQSGASIGCTIWGEKLTAETDPWQLNDIITCKSLKVTDYMGKKQVAAGDDALLVCNAEHQDATRMREWVHQNAHTLLDTKNNMTQWKTLDAIKLENMGSSREGKHCFSVLACISDIHRSIESPGYYFACGADEARGVPAKCFKKAVERSGNNSNTTNSSSSSSSSEVSRAKKGTNPKGKSPPLKEETKAKKIRKTRLIPSVESARHSRLVEHSLHQY